MILSWFPSRALNRDTYAWWMFEDIVKVERAESSGSRMGTVSSTPLVKLICGEVSNIGAYKLMKQQQQQTFVLVNNRSTATNNICCTSWLQQFEDKLLHNCIFQHAYIPPQILVLPRQPPNTGAVSVPVSYPRPPSKGGVAPCDLQTGSG